MSPTTGWLDVHGHFSLPFQNEAQHEDLVERMHASCFMVSKDWSWNIDDSIEQMDRSGVQMQLLSYLPAGLDQLRKANDYGANLVKQHPTRVGHLCALPTDEGADACLAEIDRSQKELHSDGFAVTAIRNGVMLSDPKLQPVWEKLDSMGAVVFSHPNAYAPGTDGRPAPLIEVAFETCRVAVDMLYSGIFKRYPNIKFIFAHCGGALPVLSGRLKLLGAEPWIPNQEQLTAEEIRDQLAQLYVDCAATAETGLRPALQMVGKDHVLYGSDCGVPCSTHETMLANRESLFQIEKEVGIEVDLVGLNAWRLFPSAAERASSKAMS